jgi:hypothetical protein
MTTGGGGAAQQGPRAQASTTQCYMDGHSPGTPDISLPSVNMVPCMLQASAQPHPPAAKGSATALQQPYKMLKGCCQRRLPPLTCQLAAVVVGCCPGPGMAASRRVAAGAAAAAAAASWCAPQEGWGWRCTLAGWRAACCSCLRVCLHSMASAAGAAWPCRACSRCWHTSGWLAGLMLLRAQTQLHACLDIAER